MSFDATHAGHAETRTAVIHAVLDGATVARLEAEARAQGFAFVAVDLAGAVEKADLLERTATALYFPSWFGHNWDAWFDCLADLGWIERAPGYLVLLLHARELQRAAPEALDTALSIAEDVARVWARRGIAFSWYVDIESID